MNELSKKDMTSSSKSEVYSPQQAVENFETESGRDLQAEVATGSKGKEFFEDFDEYSPYYMLDNMADVDLPSGISESEVEPSPYVS